MSFVLNLYTPNGTVAKNLECTDIVIPTVKGEINVLSDHTHLLTELATGIMKVVCPDRKRFYTITAGVCKVLKNEVTIISTTSESIDSIDLQRAERAKQIAEQKLREFENLSDIEVIKYQRKLARAELRLQSAYLK